MHHAVYLQDQLNGESWILATSPQPRQLRLIKAVLAGAQRFSITPIACSCLYAIAYSSSSSSGLHRLLDSIGQCSGSTFRVWMESFEHVINIHALELLTVLRGSARPDPLTAILADVTAWDKADSRLYSLLFFATLPARRGSPFRLNERRTLALKAADSWQRRL